MNEQIQALKKQVQALNAGEGHMAIGFTDGTKAVLSFYDGQQPAHVILDALEVWAEENNNQQLLDKIEELATLE